MLYHLMTQSAFDHQPADEPLVEPSLADEGFIHLSATAEQVTWVANRWYRDVADLVVLTIDEVVYLIRWKFRGELVRHGTYGPPERPWPECLGRSEKRRQHAGGSAGGD